MDRLGYARYEMPTPEKIFTPVVTTLIGLSVAGFVLTLLAQDFVASWLALNPYFVIRGRVWQLLTYPFVGNNALFLILDTVVMLVLGSAVEREWRSRALLGLWLVVTILCAVLWILVSLLTGTSSIITGMGAGAFGMVGAFGLLFRERRFLWFLVAVNAQTLALILIAVGIIFCLPTPIALVQILGAPIAYGYVHLLWWLGSRDESVVSKGSDYRPGGFVDID